MSLNRADRRRAPAFRRDIDAETLPRNPSGRILKRELREPYWRGHDRQVH